MCPYCPAGKGPGGAEAKAPVHAPLASVFPPHKELQGLLSGQPDRPLCDDCPPESPDMATTHCPDCKANLCSSCDTVVHSRSMELFCSIYQLLAAH